MRVILRISFRVVFVVVLSLILSLALLTITEYRPDDIEVLTVSNQTDLTMNDDRQISLMTFNLGYAGLGASEDFVLDGGTRARPDSREAVEDNLQGITNILLDNPVDVYLLQEVDLKARRSYNINQVDYLQEVLGNGFNSTFAFNFKAIFVPFPVSLTDYIGPVESGLQTLSRYHVDETERHQFPGSFAWPLRIANLKRAMLVSRIALENSDHELVIVNLHMSAYDADGSLRDAEMSYLREFMEYEYALGNYVIIGGDFNQTFPDAVDKYPLVSDGLYEAFPIEEDFLPNGFNYAIDVTSPTCRLLNQPYDSDSEFTQYYIIDGFMVSDNIRIDFVETLNYDFEYSDHNPVVLTVTLLGTGHDA